METFVYRPKGVCSREVLDAFRGVRCGAKPTSCPDQIAEALSEYARKLG